MDVNINFSNQDDCECSPKQSSCKCFPVSTCSCGQGCPCICLCPEEKKQEKGSKSRNEDALIQIIKEKDCELRELTQQYHKLAEDATKLDNLNLALQTSVASHETSLQNLEARWKQQCECLEQGYKQQIEDLNRQLQEHARKKEHKARAAEAAKSEAMMSRQILEKDLQVEREARAMLEQQFRDCCATIHALEELNKQEVLKNKDICHDLQEAQKQIQEFAKENNALQAELARLESDKKLFEQRVEQQEEQIKLLQQQQNELRNTVESMETLLAESRTAANKASASNAELVQQQKDSEAKIKSLENLLEEKTQALEKQSKMMASSTALQQASMQRTSMQQPTMQLSPMQQPTMQLSPMQQPTMQPPQMQQYLMQPSPMQRPSLHQPTIQSPPMLPTPVQQMPMQQGTMQTTTMLQVSTQPSPVQPGAVQQVPMQPGAMQQPSGTAGQLQYRPECPPVQVQLHCPAQILEMSSSSRGRPSHHNIPRRHSTSSSARGPSRVLVRESDFELAEARSRVDTIRRSLRQAWADFDSHEKATQQLDARFKETGDASLREELCVAKQVSAEYQGRIAVLEEQEREAVRLIEALKERQERSDKGAGAGKEDTCEKTQSSQGESSRRSRSHGHHAKGSRHKH